jgi:hypothetical protein
MAALTEIILEGHGIGELSLLMPTLARLNRPKNPEQASGWVLCLLSLEISIRVQDAGYVSIIEGYRSDVPRRDSSFGDLNRHSAVGALDCVRCPRHRLLAYGALTARLVRSRLALRPIR